MFASWSTFWSIAAMPLGLAICFGPALAVWLKDELSGANDETNEKK